MLDGMWFRTRMKYLLLFLFSILLLNVLKYNKEYELIFFICPRDGTVDIV